jgi:excisionase family DNA binding protein
MSTPAYLTVREAAERLRLCPSQVYKLVRKGVIPTSAIIGGAIRIPASALDATTTTTATPPPARSLGRREKITLPPGYRRLGG